MQGIVLGMTGTGKTTPLRTIISQDLARVVGAPGEPRLPMVIFDGKETRIFHDRCRTCTVWSTASAQAAEPARPDLLRYLTPFSARAAVHAGCQHDLRPFNLRKNFRQASLNYLADIVRVLFYLG
jgi:hypothetical protein